jgi:hypothetical protein
MKEFKLEYTMLAIIIVMIVCVVIYGMKSLNKAMDPPFEKNFYKWEYSAFCPPTTTPEELLRIKSTLKSNGFTRVVMRAKYDETWTDVKRAGTEIFATRQLPEITNATGKDD